MNNQVVVDQQCPPACPGCPHGNITRQESIKQKTGWIRHALKPFCDKIEPMIAPGDQGRLGYRDCVTLKAAYEYGKWRFGLVKNDNVIPIPECPIHTGRVNRIINSIACLLPDESLFPCIYLVINGRQVTLVVKTGKLQPSFLKSRDLAEAVENAGADALWLHLFPSAGKKVFAKYGWHLAWGKPYSTDADGFAYGPTTFLQVTPDMAEKALDMAETFLTPRADDIVIDLCCGIGKSLARWTGRGACTIGIELSGESVKYARKNVNNAMVLRGRNSHRIPQIMEKASGFSPENRIVYANPPRTGLEEEVLEFIAKELKPARMAYLSCSASTLCRDLEYLCRHGFQVESIIPFDFFPRTLHVEALALVSGMKQPSCHVYHHV